MSGSARLLPALAVMLIINLAGAEQPVRPIAPTELRSGYEFLSDDLRELQDDELANPGMLWVEHGEQLWRQAAGKHARACYDCHDQAAASMQGVAVRYPAYDADAGRVINLEQRINLCRTQHQGAPALAYESEDLLALTAYVAYQSRGLPVQVAIDGPAESIFERGLYLYQLRIGQMNLACTHCHDQNWDRRLLSDTIGQGHANAYPVYRLEWQTLGSLQRRLRSCNSGVRAQMQSYGDADYVALELYLAWRSSGLPLETPGIRR